MTIEFRKGNLLDAANGIIVHGCNMQGKMGSGVARQIKFKYPECYKTYKKQLPMCSLGDCIWHAESEKIWIVNALTQEFYGTNDIHLDYDALYNCLNSVINYASRSDNDIHLPDMIGCGLAGGDRNRVIKIIENLVHRNNFFNTLTIWSL